MIKNIEKGSITRLMVGGQSIKLRDGNIREGFLTTKDYGDVRILGVGNPVYLWVTPEQKNKLMKLK